MAYAGTPHQGDAPDLSSRRRGHDQPRRPPRGRNPPKSSDQIQRKPHLHLYRINPGKIIYKVKIYFINPNSIGY